MGLWVCGSVGLWVCGSVGGLLKESSQKGFTSGILTKDVYRENPYQRQLLKESLLKVWVCGSVGLWICGSVGLWVNLWAIRNPYQRTLHRESLLKVFT